MGLDYLSNLFDRLFGKGNQSYQKSKLEEELEVPDFIKEAHPEKMLHVLDELIKIEEYLPLMLQMEVLETKGEYHEMIWRIKDN